ncbi:putative glucanase [Aspergillus recurvatus]
MASGILRVVGNRVVDNNGHEVILRGAATGGWMNMENFITCYPAHESQHQAAMLKVLGPEKYGDDMNPRVLKDGGFKHLDRVVELCAKQNIYPILDMHITPGGENPNWHFDNPTNYAAFWEYKDHQGQTVWLWEQIAARYMSNPWIAGYNPLNELCDPEHVRLPAFHERVENVIRAVDPDHILWLGRNTFAMEWRGFDRVLPKCVYAMHDYVSMGFPTGLCYQGTREQKSYLEHHFLRKAEFMNKNHTLWNSEFRPVYTKKLSPTDTEAASINQEHYNLLGEQLRIYDKYKIHWSTWLHKDISLQGMIHTNPDSPWNKLIQPFLDNKRALMLDHWGRDSDTAVDAVGVLKPLVEWIDRVSPSVKETYPTPWNTERHCSEGSFRHFWRHHEKALEQLARSFAFEECVQREGLNEILRVHASVRGD